MALTTLVRPPSAIGRLALTLNVTPPLSVAYLAGSLFAAGIDVHVIDAVGEAIGQTYPGFHPDVLVNGMTVAQIVARVPADTTLIGVSCMFSTEWPIIRDLVAALAESFPGVPIVCGGEHPSAAPDHALRSAPALAACVLGEGEESIVDVARAVAQGKPLLGVPGLVVRTAAGPVRTASRARIRAIDDIPPPRWEATPIETYLAGGHSFGVNRGRTIPMIATRGCPYRCTFCSSPQMWTTRYYARTPSLVVDEIEGYVERFGVQNIDFYDLTAIIRKDWIMAFCRELLARRLGVTWQLPSGTRSEAIDAEVCDALYRAGCRNVSYAPESGSPAVLRRIKKKVKLENLEASMRAAVERGLNVKANVLIGFPGEGRAELAETLGFLVRMAALGVHDVSIWTFSPYPGSELFDELRAAGKIGEFDDAYFASLLSYSDLAGAVSWSDELSSGELRACRLAGMALFYALSFLRRPGRVGSLVSHAATGRFESRLEMSVANLARKVALAW
jgi:anaerobic magnesium-protoporphyrin IX monomethyl ester cyclase